MRCNACWREVEGRAITTTCNHLLCIHNAQKIYSIPTPVIPGPNVLSKWKISLIITKGPEDANKILSSDGACPICDQVLSKRYEEI